MVSVLIALMILSEGIIDLIRYTCNVFKIDVFWDVTSYSLLDAHRRFREPAAHIVRVGGGDHMYFCEVGTLVPYNLIRV
jgi:hypothetical protein